MRNCTCWFEIYTSLYNLRQLLSVDIRIAMENQLQSTVTASCRRLLVHSETKALFILQKCTMYNAALQFCWPLRIQLTDPCEDTDKSLVPLIVTWLSHSSCKSLWKQKKVADGRFHAMGCHAIICPPGPRLLPCFTFGWFRAKSGRTFRTSLSQVFAKLGMLIVIWETHRTIQWFCGQFSWVLMPETLTCYRTIFWVSVTGSVLLWPSI